MKLQETYTLMLFAAIGAAIGTVIDYYLSLDSSLLYGISELMDQVTTFIMSPPLPFYMAAAALVVLGSLSILYARPLTRKGAFTCGFAAIAILAIFIP